jgi:hypothetical protein
LLHTSLKVKHSNFESIAHRLGTVSPLAVHAVADRVARGDHTVHNDEEKRVLGLMKEVNVISSHVQGSSAARVARRNEIRGLMMHLGMPSFYITINPADHRNPLVKFMAGADIDIDNLLSGDVPQYDEQTLLVAKNPFIGAKFFNIYMKAFIKALLGYDRTSVDIDGGILGLVKGYYGCVETQGRGSLHCHMLVWVEGSLSPDELRKRVLDPTQGNFCHRLLEFLDDTISNCIPPDPDPQLRVHSSRFHPCSVRALDPKIASAPELQKDLYHIVSCSQVHSHKKTCYKYWKGAPHPKECRFNLDANRYTPVSSIDMETGELCLRCLDGLVNNFNATIIQAMRCNMDIKFIGSGPAAKAILYYITDYITKSELKTNVAYAALEVAISKLGEYNPVEDSLTIRAKRMLQKCAHAMVSHQEVPAQLVASYLMDYNDHYTSHSYKSLYWTSFESLLERELPSPECYRQVTDVNFSKDNTLDNISHSEILQVAPEIENVDIQPDLCNVQEDEVTLELDSDGVLVKKSSQVMDYVC